MSSLADEDRTGRLRKKLTSEAALLARKMTRLFERYAEQGIRPDIVRVIPPGGQRGAQGLAISHCVEVLSFEDEVEDADEDSEPVANR